MHDPAAVPADAVCPRLGFYWLLVLTVCVCASLFLRYFSLIGSRNVTESGRMGSKRECEHDSRFDSDF